jgi:hypothetical protein
MLWKLEFFDYRRLSSSRPMVYDQDIKACILFEAIENGADLA